MKNKLFKNMNMALIGLTAVSLAQTAFAQAEVMDLNEGLKDSIPVSKLVVAPAVDLKEGLNSIQISKPVFAPAIEEIEENFVTFDHSNSPTSQDLRDVIIGHHSYAGKQNFSNSYEPLMNGKDSLWKGITNAGPLVKNIRHNINRADKIGDSIKNIIPVTFGATFDLLTFQENIEGFTTRVLEPINETKTYVEEILKDLPEIRDNITSVSYDLKSGITSLGQAGYSSILGVYHFGHVGVQKAQAAYNSLSNWWNSK